MGFLPAPCPPQNWATTETKEQPLNVSLSAEHKTRAEKNEHRINSKKRQQLYDRHSMEREKVSRLRESTSRV